MIRLVVIATMLAFIAGLAFLTYAEIVRQGFSAGSAVSIFVLVLLSVGIVGALRNPPR
jgi:hypothetical protein